MTVVKTLTPFAAVVVLAAIGSGCGLTTSGTPDTSAPATAAPASQAAPKPTPASKPQTFTGTGQRNVGTVEVPVDSALSWTCPSCGDTNFIVNNADGDSGSIPTNALGQTSGVDPISAGTYHTVVVDTTGGPWTITIGTGVTPETSQAPAEQPAAPVTPQPATGSGQGGYSSCDANISAKAGTTTCPFAENAFYEYWSSGSSDAITVYSPTTGRTYGAHCGATSGEVACTTDAGAGVKFAQGAVDAYSQSQADRYAATHQTHP